MAFERIYADADYWLSKTGSVTMTWSVFNPNGPTLNTLGVFRTNTEGVMKVFYRWLHFTTDEAYIIGEIDLNSDDWHKQYVSILSEAFEYAPNEGQDEQHPVMVPCIPAFVTQAFPDGWEEIPWSLLANSPVINESDWGRESYYSRKYGADLFGRAGEELKEATQQSRAENPSSEFLDFTEAKHSGVPTFVDSDPIVYDSHPITRELFDEWRERVTGEDYLGQSTFNFSQAWVGATQMTGIPVAYQFEDVRDFLKHFDHAIWSDEFTTEALKKTLGIE
jgi:hypothetical protein